MAKKTLVLTCQPAGPVRVTLADPCADLRLLRSGRGLYFKSYTLVPQFFLQPSMPALQLATTSNTGSGTIAAAVLKAYVKRWLD